MKKFDYTDELALSVQLKRSGVRKNARKTPLLIHFSDIHDSAEHFDSIMDFYNEKRELITDVVLTGDIVWGRFCEGLKPKVAEHLKSVLPVIGNHDALASTDGYDWSKVVPEPELYERYFANRSDLVIDKGKTYWYKDYEEYSLRMIGINAMLSDDAAQLAWLERVLAEACEKGFSVIIAEHYPPSNAKPIDCNFTSVTIAPADFPGGVLHESIQARVADFKSSGGEFICFLTGHTHVDFISVNENYPDQLFVTVDTANPAQAIGWSDTYRVEGFKSAELFNLFSYDTERRLVKIVRCGASADCLLRSKKSLCISYINGKIISQN